MAGRDRGEVHKKSLYNSVLIVLIKLLMKQYKFHQKDIECNIQYVTKSFAKSIWLKNDT